MQKLNLFQIEKKLLEINKKVFTSQDIILLSGANRRAVEGFLSYNVRKNKLIRLKNGVYGLQRGYISQYIIANMLYRPSYLSFETALSYYGIIPETVYSFTSATSKSTREFITDSVSFKYYKIKKDAFTGYLLQKIEGEQILIATPEKALADYCYFVHLGKKSWNDRSDLKKINILKFKEYLLLFGKTNLIPFIKKYIPNL